MDGDTYSLRQSVYHPSLWFVVRAPCLTRPHAVRLPDESDLPDLSALGECTHLAAILVYVDDFLAAGPRQVLQPLLEDPLQGDAEEAAELAMGMAAARASKALSLGNSSGPAGSGIFGLSGSDA